MSRPPAESASAPAEPSSTGFGGPPPGRTITVGQVIEPLRRNVLFRYFWLSGAFFFSGVWAQTVVLGWLAFDLTQSEFAVAAFTAARFSPQLLGPFGGVVADRVDRPRLLIISQIAALVLSVAAAALASTGAIVFWQVVVIGFLVGATQSPLMPTRFALIMDLVGRRGLTNANALNMSALFGSRIISPAIAGALIAAYGADVALWFSAAWHLPATLLLLPLRGRTPRTVASGSRMAADLLEGFRFALRSREMIGVLLASTAANLTAWPVIQGFLPVFAEEVLDVGAGGLGLLVAANGVGALIGSLVIASLGDFASKGKLFLVATGLFGLLLTAFALATGMPLALVFMFAGGAASSGFGIMQSTLVLLIAPEEARGRATGVLSLSIAVMPFALLGQGAVAAAVGVVPTTVVAGLFLATSMIGVALVAPGMMRVR